MRKTTMLQLFPICGLANRIQAIDSAISYANHYNMKLTIYWEPYVYLYCPYQFLFEPVEDIEIIELPPGTFHLLKPDTYNISRPDIFKEYNNSLRFNVPYFKTTNHQTFLCDALSGKKHLIIEACSRFYPNPTMYSWTKPKKDILEIIANETDSFDENIIGVHIRRTDHYKSIQNSPLELFYVAMDNEIGKNPSTKFYVASDCLDSKKSLIKKYGDRIKTNILSTNRNTIHGMKRALVELYSLSKTQKILGSYASSFSTLAADIGTIPLQVINCQISSD